MNKNKLSIQRLFTLFLIGATLFLTGCGGGGGSNAYYNSNNSLAPYYDSTKTSISNLQSVGSIYSAYSGVDALSIRNIPIDSNEVWYACTVTNPKDSSISNVTLTPPLAYANIRASCENKKSPSYLANYKSNIFYNAKSLRENPITKARLKEELRNKFLAQQAENKRPGIRAAISHTLEKVGQLATIHVLNKNRNCKLAKISAYGKFFIDQDGDGFVPAPIISDETINNIATEFDTYIYPILRDNFGNDQSIFWDDVDNDRKLSIVFSPVYNNYGDGVAGIFDSSSLNHPSYSRDVIGISVKSEDTELDKWFMDARETIAHEMQHIVNHSAKPFESEEIWIDEGLAVCAEILYRKARSEKNLMTFSPYYGTMHEDFAGNDQRLFYYAYLMPEISATSFDITSTDMDGKQIETLAHYGQKGLFFYYLYEQYGAKVVKQLCQGESGRKKFSKLIPDRSLEQLEIDFNFATLYEKLRNITFTKLSQNPYYSAKSQHRFETDMNLNFVIKDGNSYTEVTEDDINLKVISLDQRKPINILSDESYSIGLPSNGGTMRFFFKQPKNFSNIIHNTSYSLTISSSAPVAVNIIRLF